MIAPKDTARGDRRIHIVGAFVEPAIAELAGNALREAVLGMTYTPCYDLDDFVAAIVREGPDVVLVAGPWLVNLQIAREKCAEQGATMPPTIACVHTTAHGLIAKSIIVDESIDVRAKRAVQVVADLTDAMHWLGIHVRPSPHGRVLVAAENSSVAEGMIGLVKQNPAIEVCGVCTSSSALHSAIEIGSPQVVILANPWLDAVEQVHESMSARNLPWPRWFLADPILNDGQVEQAQRLGIVRCGLHELFSTLGDAPRDSVVGSRLSAHYDVFPLQLAAIAGDDTDLDILRLLATGASNEAIAGSVFLSLQTVKNRVSRMLKVAGVANRTELAVQLARGDVSSVRLAS